MCSATNQMVSKVAELMELRKMIEDLTAEAELIADEIKAYMGEEETMTAGSYVVRYQNPFWFGGCPSLCGVYCIRHLPVRSCFQSGNQQGGL